MSRMRSIWFVAGLFPALVCTAQTYHDNVVIILDGSGSMTEKMRSMPVKKMEAAKDALKQVLGQIPETTHVGLLVFSTSQRRDPWVQALGPCDIGALGQAIDAVQAGGGTPLGAFIKLGADRLLEEREKQFGYGSYRLLVVTDGQATDGSLMRRYAPEVLARGITMDVIGVDMQQDHALATMAHSYRKADDPAALTQALADVFAEVSADDTQPGQEVEFALLEGIPLEIAAAMVETVSKPVNTPLGETRGGVSPTTRAGPRPRTAAQPPPAIPQPSRPRTNADGDGFSFPWVLVIAVVIGLTVIRSLKRGRRR